MPRKKQQRDLGVEVGWGKLTKVKYLELALPRAWGCSPRCLGDEGRKTLAGSRKA